LLQNDLEEPEWGSENKDELEKDSKTKEEKNNRGVRSSKEAGNQ